MGRFGGAFGHGHWPGEEGPGFVFRVLLGRFAALVQGGWGLGLQGSGLYGFGAWSLLEGAGDLVSRL